MKYLKNFLNAMFFFPEYKNLIHLVYKSKINKENFFFKFPESQ